MPLLKYHQCRTCYNSLLGLKLLTSLPENGYGYSEQKSYGQLLNDVCNINVMDDTGQWPQFICSSCSEKLKSAYNFIEKTRLINQELKTIANYLQTQADFINGISEDIPLNVKLEAMDDVQIVSNKKTEAGKIEAHTLSNLKDITKKTSPEDKSDNINFEFINFDLSLNKNSNKIRYKKTKKVLKRKTKDKYKPTVNETIFTCDLCQKSFGRVVKLNRHKRYTHMAEQDKTPCQLCDLKFARSYHLKRHIENMHNPDNVKVKKNIKNSESSNEDEDTD